MREHTTDVLVVGAGGAGLSAAAAVPPGVSVAIISKLYPFRSHTGAAQGGVGAALGNMEEDKPEWHAFDTVKGSDYLGDQDSIQVMCEDAVDTIYDLERKGLPFSRLADGRISQRAFGGHTRNFGEAAVKRAAHAADRTGLVILHTLIQQAARRKAEVFSEMQAVELLVEDNICRGLVAVALATGERHLFRAKAVILATGGYGRCYQVTSNAYSLTGDGMAIVQRAGLPLQDMEFVQFHPTGLHKLGILISEAARGEGGILRNATGERFMERYAPTIKDLAPRDLVSRAIYEEIKAGRGVGGEGFVHLDLTHLSDAVMDEKLPEVTDFARTYLRVEPKAEPIPVAPTTHYAMGGVPTDVNGQVLAAGEGALVAGLYAAGETACVSVHGANRLGTNSLLDIIVFGRRAGAHAGEFAAAAALAPLPGDAADHTSALAARWRRNSRGPTVASLRERMQTAMMDHASVFRQASGLETALSTLAEIRDDYGHLVLQDRSKAFNYEQMEALELGYMLDVAESIAAGALRRTESRGAHCRADHPDRDDKNWLVHTMHWRGADGEARWGERPVALGRFEPKPRVY